MNISINLIERKKLFYIYNKKKRKKVLKKKLKQNPFCKYLKLFYKLILFLFLFNFKIKKKEKLYSHINSEKWIIMATNNTQNISYYSIFENLNDWKTVIISLNEANDNIWHITNSFDRIIYLSIKDQLKLSYKIFKYISMNSYSHKNIGYLFAIEHGAKEIYEIDDNIMIKDSNYINYIFNKSFYERITLCKNNRGEMINPYSYFGLNNIWPRGFRLNNINKDHNNIYINLASTQINLKPLIYQGLINGESDIDSYFVLTRSEKGSKINIIFPKNYPLIYLPGNFIPINSKNTKYLYDIFPMLILPSFLNERLADIFRGYIMQCYAWRYNGTTIYINSNAFNYKNKYKSLNDFYLTDKDLYYKLEKFLTILEKEKDFKTNNPKNFILYLIRKMISNEIFSKKDLKAYKAFIKDLSNIGYIYNQNFNKEIILNEDIYFTEHAKLKINLVPQQKILLKNICKTNIKVLNHKSSNIIFNDILLIINYNYKQLTYLNEYLINLYKKNFPHIISISPGNLTENSDIISCQNSNNGRLAYICIKKIYEKYNNFKGYLIVNDDNIMKPWELEGINQDIPWINLFDFRRIYVNTLKEFQLLEEMIKNNITLSEKIFKMVGDNIPPKIWNDMLYLPNSIMDKYCDILDDLFSKTIFHELATAFAFAIISLNEYKIINSLLIWGKERNNMINIFKNSFGFAFVHPIKISNIDLREKIKQYYYFINGENF